MNCAEMDDTQHAIIIQIQLKTRLIITNLNVEWKLKNIRLFNKFKQQQKKTINY